LTPAADSRIGNEIEAGAAIQNRLGQHDEMRRWGSKHDILNDLRHALACRKEGTVKKQAEAGEAAWEAAEAQLETQWKGFETGIKKYLEDFGKDIKQQQAVFQSQVTAQINTWRETADKIHTAAAECAAERRNDIDAVVSRMRADATAAEEKLQQLARAGTESWSALNAALTETRAVFDRANQAAREAIKRATGSAQ
jgi:hypothetical protein